MGLNRIVFIQIITEQFFSKQSFSGSQPSQYEFMLNVSV